MANSRRINVSAETLRELFNESGYWELAKRGDLIEKIYSEAPPQKRSGEPPGTLSQIVAYLDPQGRQVAIVHQYLRKDGSIGGSGRPDPKKVFYQGNVYVLR
jgi:hypothetical protein